MWVLFALGAAVLTSFNPILYKRMLKDTDPVVVVWGVILLALPVLALFTFASLSQLPKLDWLFLFGVLGSAGLNAGAHLALTKALRLADVSLVTPLLIFSPVFTLLISTLFLGEIPSLRGLFGVVLVLLGAYWLNHRPGMGCFMSLKALTPTSDVTLVLLAGLLWAITPLFEKTAILHTTPQSPRFTAFVATALLALILTPLALYQGRSAIYQLSRNRYELGMAGLIAGIAPTLGYTAYSLGLVGYVTTLFRLSALMTIVWSFLFLKERGITQRLPASLLMVIGAILIVV